MAVGEMKGVWSDIKTPLEAQGWLSLQSTYSTNLILTRKTYIRSQAGEWMPEVPGG